MTMQQLTAVRTNAIRETLGSLPEVMRVSGPLVLAMSGYTATLIMDRLSLAAYSKETLVASGPAVFASMTLVTFFTGFMYSVQPRLVRAHEDDRSLGGSGRTLQELARSTWISLMASLALCILCPAVAYLSTLSGRPQEVVTNEVKYLLMTGAFGSVMVFNVVGAAYFSATGRTSTTMRITLFGQLTAIVCTYCLVFGRLGFPELGMLGSALAILLGATATLGGYIAHLEADTRKCIFEMLTSAKIWQGISWGETIKTGAAVGANESADELGNTAIIWAIGVVGVSALAANNFNIVLNYLSVIPLLGIGTGANILVARAATRRRRQEVIASVHASILIALIYSLIVAALLRLYGEDITRMFNIDEYSSGVFTLSLKVTDLLVLYAIAFSISFTSSRALQAIGEHKFVLMTRLVLMWCGSVPSAFMIAILYSHREDALVWTWLSLSAFEFIVGIVLLTRFNWTCRKRL